MDNLDLLRRHFKQKEEKNLIVGENGEKVKFESIEADYSYNRYFNLAFVFSYDCSQIKILVKRIGHHDDAMKVRVPDVLKSSGFVDTIFENVQSLEVYLTKMLEAWVINVESVFGSKLIWE